MGYTRVVWALLLQKGSPRFGFALGEKLSKSLGCKGTSCEHHICWSLSHFEAVAPLGNEVLAGCLLVRWHILCNTSVLLSVRGERVWNYFFYEPLARTLRWYPVALSPSRKFTSSFSICDTWAPELFSVCAATPSAVVLAFSHPEMQDLAMDSTSERKGLPWWLQGLLFAWEIRGLLNYA